jgi:hypothetical protein
MDGACQADYGPTASHRPALDVHFQTIHRAGDQSIISAAEALASDPDLKLEALRLSAALGFEIPEAIVQEFGGVKALVVCRFDRAIDQMNRVIRVHQEVLAQGLGLPLLTTMGEIKDQPRS